MKKFILTFLFAFTLMISQSAFAYLDDLDGLLSTHVKPVTAKGIQYNGVNYDAWAKDPRHKTVLNEILATNPKTLVTKNEKLAYWINAYNVLTIDLITREGEQDSIKNLGSTFVNPWKKHKWTITGTEYTLDTIEHKIIRPMGEPRIHFAINCAAKSCPDLRAEAYRADTLETQLDNQTQLTLKNSTKGYKKGSDNSVTVSKVMDWFKEDFNKGDLNSWLKTYRADDINNDTKIKFYDYDWSLNKQ